MPTQPDYSASFAVETLTNRPEKGSTGHRPDPTRAAPTLSRKESLHLLTWTHFAAGGGSWCQQRACRGAGCLAGVGILRAADFIWELWGWLSPSVLQVILKQFFYLYVFKKNTYSLIKTKQM